VAALRKFRSAEDPAVGKQELLDTVRATAALKPLLGDMLAVVDGLKRVGALKKEK
jgi:hypothetical protein